MEIYGFIAAVFLIAGFVQGMTGFGSALVALPVLTIVLDIKEVVPLSILNSIVISTILCWQLKRNIRLEKIYPLLFGCIPGIVFGVVLLKQISGEHLQTALGIMLVGYGVYGLSFNPKPKSIHTIWAYLAGFSTGAIGAAFSAGGPPSVIYATLTGWSKDDIKATLAGLFLFTSLVVAIAHAVSGMTTRQVCYDFAASFSFLILGVCMGIKCYRRLKTEGYRKVLFVFLVIMGLMMVVRL